MLNYIVYDYICLFMALKKISTCTSSNSDRFVNDDKSATEGKTGLQLLIATFNHMRHPYQLLIIPLTIWSGVEQAFLGADYTAVSIGSVIRNSFP